MVTHVERSQMDITFLGQAGLFIRTRAGSILCDPWFNPAYFASWFPFPANYHIDPETIGSPDYLYISHLHHDHFDPEFLRAHVSKEAQVVLPEYPVNDLEQELQDLGFHRFIKTRDLQPVEVDGLLFTIISLTSPTDGPIGDSALVVDDGETRIFNQNDAEFTLRFVIHHDFGVGTVQKITVPPLVADSIANSPSMRFAR